jgi:DNA-binding NarL/FixJ family response regulator
MKSKIKALIVDDHALIRRGLADLLRFEKDFSVVGEASNGQEAVARAEATGPDVVVMDMMMPVMGGVEATRQILAKVPAAKVLLLTSYGNSADIAAAVAAGAAGALTKDTPNDELPGILRRVVAGERVFSREIEASLKELPPPLTDRQREMIELVSKGLTSADIAKLLGISADAVNQHLTLVCSKLGASNRSEAVAIAMSRHLIRP